jgi:pimeloyl-ACP methyl ester carboxylesterase
VIHQVEVTGMTLRTEDPETNDSQVPPNVPEGRGVSLGKVVGGSLVAGFVTALYLPFLPAGTVDVDFATAMVLFGWAIGWGLLAAVSMRFTDQPQRWAVVPAVFMAVAGVVLLVGSDSAVNALGWVWPPVLMVIVVWAWLRAKRDMRSRARVWLVNPVLVILMLLAVGGVYEQVSESTAPAVAMRGQLVDVGPYRLHLECTGSGSPTVILEPGGGGTAATMGLIAPAVARDTRVCVYDRAEKGWSDFAEDPPDGAQNATDLHSLLHRAHVPGPYVLAGHSFGGLYVRSYAKQFPRDVVGLVLIDSTAGRNTPVSADKPGSYSLLRHASSLIATTSNVGLGWLVAYGSPKALPPKYGDDARATAATGKEMAGFLDEFGTANRSEAEAGTLHTLNGKPLIVLTATVDNAKGWMTDQNAMARLSTNSLHRVEPGATHDDLVSDPAHTVAVVRAIHDVVVSVRTGTRLNNP